MFLNPIYITLALRKWPVHPMGTDFWMAWDFGTLEGSIWDSQHIFLFPFYTPPRLGTRVYRYFLTIWTKYHLIRETKCNSVFNQHPNQTFESTWWQPTLHKLQCWTQVICGFIGIIEQTLIWEVSGNHVFLPHWYDNEHTSCLFQ